MPKQSSLAAAPVLMPEVCSLNIKNINSINIINNIAQIPSLLLGKDNAIAQGTG